MAATFTPLSGFLGGLLIGLAAVTLLIANGRIAGVSGIIGGLLRPAHGDAGWRILFVTGLWLGALCFAAIGGGLFPVEVKTSLRVIVVAGLLVGIGTRMGSGCTSGHGVCGIARFSRRSLVATAVFMAAGVATVFVTRHLLQ